MRRLVSTSGVSRSGWQLYASLFDGALRAIKDSFLPHASSNRSPRNASMVGLWFRPPAGGFVTLLG
eukprot:9201004-Lingulodinium_polyedra.AAC.1